MATTKIKKDRIEQLTKDDVGLSNVDNTSDLNKPISTLTQTALDGKISGTLGGAGQIPYSNGTSLIFTNNVFYNSSLARVGVRTTSPNSIFHVAGSFAGFYRNVTSAFAMDNLDYTIHFTGAGNFTQTLLTAVGITGRIIELVNNSTGTITLQALLPELIGTSNTYKLLSNQSLSIKSTGSNWIIISNGINALSTKNEAGQVVVNYSGLSVNNLTPNVFKQLDISSGTPTINTSSTKYPSSTPNSYVGFFDSARNGGTTTFQGRLIENPIVGQYHRYRIIGTWNRTSATVTQTLTARLRNPVSGFSLTSPTTIDASSTSGQFVAYFDVVADSNSINSPNGYIIEFAYSNPTADSSFTVTPNSISRFSIAIEP